MALRLDGSPVDLDDLFTDRKSYTGPGVLIPGMEALEQPEYLFDVGLVEADTVVLKNDLYFLAPGVGKDFYTRAAAGLGKLQGVGKKVFKKLFELGGVSTDGG